MTFTHRIGSAAAALGLATAGLVGSLAAAGPAAAADGAAAPASPTADARATAASELYGPYSSLGTCNYWRYAVQAAGHRTEPCHRFPAVGEYWFFEAY